MPTWRDTNPVSSDVPPRVPKEYRRGGASVPKPKPVTHKPATQKKPLPWAVCFFIAMIIMALLAGVQLNNQNQITHVDPSTVDPTTCVANGPITDVWYYNFQPGVYRVKCASGVVLTTGIYK